MARFQSAVTSIFANWLLIAMWGVVNVRVVGGIWTYISLLGLIIGFFLMVVICGRIVARISENPIPDAGVLLLAHWRNALSVTLALTIPAVLLASAVSLPDVGVFYGLAFYLLIRLIVGIFLVFALPIVFMKRIGLVAIPAALAFLRANPTSSSGVMFLVVVASLILVGRILVLPYLPANTWIASIVTASVVSGYLIFLAFAAATSLLVGGSVGRRGAA